MKDRTNPPPLSTLIQKQRVGLSHQLSLFFIQYVFDLDESEKIVHPGAL